MDADADVDHRADGLARVAGPGAAAHGFAEDTHVIQGRPHLGHHVLSGYEDGPRRQIAQGYVQNRPALGEVDGLASEHLVAHGLHARAARQVVKERHGLDGDSALRVVEQQIPEAQRKALETPRILGEQFAHGLLRQFALVLLQLLPSLRVDNAHGWISQTGSAVPLSYSIVTASQPGNPSCRKPGMPTFARPTRAVPTRRVRGVGELYTCDANDQPLTE